MLKTHARLFECLRDKLQDELDERQWVGEFNIFCEYVRVPRVRAVRASLSDPVCDTGSTQVPRE